MAAAAAPSQDTAYGQIKSYRVTRHREVIMTCQGPDGGPDIEIRALPIELDTMLRNVREAPSTPGQESNGGQR